MAVPPRRQNQITVEDWSGLLRSRGVSMGGDGIASVGPVGHHTQSLGRRVCRSTAPCPFVSQVLGHCCAPSSPWKTNDIPTLTLCRKISQGNLIITRELQGDSVIAFNDGWHQRYQAFPPFWVNDLSHPFSDSSRSELPERLRWEC